MKIKVTILSYVQNPPLRSFGFIESTHVSAFEIQKDCLFVMLSSKQQLYILNETEVYEKLILHNPTS